MDREDDARGRLAPVLLAWLLLLGQASAVPAALAQGRHLLWEVSSGSQRGWLLGSIHFGRPQMYPLPGIMREAFAGSDALVVEVNVLDLDPGEAREMVAAMGSYAEGETLQEHVSPQTWKAFTDFVGRYELPVPALSRLKPWLAAITLMQLELVRTGFDEALGVDRHFLKLARERDMPVVELESFEGQMKIFQRLSAAEQDGFLRSTLEDLRQGRSLFESALDAWKGGDAAGVDTLLNESLRDLPGMENLYRLVLTDRNRAMAERIAGLLAGGRECFVVVGAAHMVGEQGIVSLLRERGYTVTQH